MGWSGFAAPPQPFSACELVGQRASVLVGLFQDAAEVKEQIEAQLAEQQRMIDTEGQVDRFTKRLGKMASDANDKRSKEAKRRAKRQIAEVVDEEVSAAEQAEPATPEAE